MYPDAKSAGEHYDDLLKVKERLDKDPNCNTYRMKIINDSIKEADAHYSALENAIGYLKSTTVIFFKVTFSGSDWGPKPVTLTIGIDLAN